MSHTGLLTISTTHGGGLPGASLSEKELEQACSAALAELEALLQGKGLWFSR